MTHDNWNMIHDIRYTLYGIWYWIYDIWHMNAASRYMTYDIYDIWHMIYDVWYIIYDIYDIWFMICDIWNIMYDVRCMIYGIWHMFMIHAVLHMACAIWCVITVVVDIGYMMRDIRKMRRDMCCMICDVRFVISGFWRAVFDDTNVMHDTRYMAWVVQYAASYVCHCMCGASCLMYAKCKLCMTYCFTTYGIRYKRHAIYCVYVCVCSYGMWHMAYDIWVMGNSCTMRLACGACCVA